MKPFSAWQSAPSSILSRTLRWTSGSSLLRKRKTAASLMCSMRCSELLRTRTSSTTASWGMAKRSPADSTIKAETIASVRGILMLKRVPWPSTDLTSMVPPISSILARTTSMPMPRPETLVIFWAVEKPGSKMKRWICASDIFSICASLARPRAIAVALIRSVLKPGAVVGNLDHDVAAFMAGAETDGAFFRLAGRPPRRRHLEAVVGGIAHHVNQRILDQLEHLAVELGLGAVHARDRSTCRARSTDPARSAAASARQRRSAASASS